MIKCIIKYPKSKNHFIQITTFVTSDEKTACIRFADYIQKYDGKIKNKNKFFLILKPINKRMVVSKKLTTTKTKKNMESQDKITKEYKTTDNNYFPCTVEGWKKAVEHQYNLDNISHGNRDNLILKID